MLQIWNTVFQNWKKKYQLLKFQIIIMSWKKRRDEKSYQKKTLENQRVLINNYIKNIEDSFKETAQVKEEKALKVYELEG
ncbi:MAG: hypothetical protein V8S58_01655 [Lachnospiraceae bacterium]